MHRKRTVSSGSSFNEETNAHFNAINERQVDDIHLEFFYKPHSLILLFVCIIGL